MVTASISDQVRGLNSQLKETRRKLDDLVVEKSILRRQLEDCVGIVNDLFKHVEGLEERMNKYESIEVPPSGV